MDFINIPHELVFNILSNLNRIELTRLIITCKFFNNFIKSDNFITMLAKNIIIKCTYPNAVIEFKNSKKYKKIVILDNLYMLQFNPSQLDVYDDKFNLKFRIDNIEKIGGHSFCYKQDSILTTFFNVKNNKNIFCVENNYQQIHMRNNFILLEYLYHTELYKITNDDAIYFNRIDVVDIKFVRINNRYFIFGTKNKINIYDHNLEHIISHEIDEKYSDIMISELFVHIRIHNMLYTYKIDDWRLIDTNNIIGTKWTVGYNGYPLLFMCDDSIKLYNCYSKNIIKAKCFNNIKSYDIRDNKLVLLYDDKIVAHFLI